MAKLFYLFIRILFGAFIIFYISDVFKNWDQVDFGPIFEKTSLFKVILCISAYLLSHFVRALRISLMIGRQNFSISTLIKRQYFTNSINLLIPFKLGEIYRIIEFDKLIKEYQKTIFTIIAERSIDFILIFTGMCFCIYFVDKPIWEVKLTLYIGSIIVFLMLYIFMAMPQNLRFSNIFLAKRYTDLKTVKLMKFTSSIHDSVEQVRDIFLKEKATLFVLSVIIWTLEVSSFYFLLPFLPSIWHTLLLACLVFMSGILPSGTLGLGGIQLAFYFMFSEASDTNLSLGLSLSYQVFIFIPAVILGLGIWLFERAGNKSNIQGA